MDTLSLAKNMVREIQATDSNFSGKVAKISGHALNKKDTADTLSKLKNGALIICKASEMNDATANVLHKALQQESQGIVIILEDTKRDIDKFLEKHEKLRECFTARMDVEASAITHWWHSANSMHGRWNTLLTNSESWRYIPESKICRR